VRGPLHGIPIALKDNIQTTDMPTTGGALAFDAFVPPYESTLTKNLRVAGAVIIVKTTMTELANWVAGGPLNAGGYNALVGYSMNPTILGVIRATLPSMVALPLALVAQVQGWTAANFWAANVGTETSGSILTRRTRICLWD